MFALQNKSLSLDFPLTFSKRTPFLQYADFVEVKNDRFSPCLSLLLTYGRKMILETPIFCSERTSFFLNQKHLKISKTDPFSLSFRTMTRDYLTN